MLARLVEVLVIDVCATSPSPLMSTDSELTTWSNRVFLPWYSTLGDGDAVITL